MATLADVLDYGPILAVDEDYGFLVTGNGSYFNLWAFRPDATYENTDCCVIPDGRAGTAGMYGHTAAEFWDAGKAALEAWLTPDDEEEE